jgi:hypothetical protein
MAIHQCPFCELRFISNSEVEWHLLEGHSSRSLATSSADWAVASTRSRPHAHAP